MSTSPRRQFLRILGALASMAACQRASGPAAATRTPGPGPGADGRTLAPEPVLLGGERLEILVLGGTGFLGPHLVEAMQLRGHTPTLFNRGKTRPDLFPAVEKLRGDRDGDLRALRGRRWDAVIDTSGYVPRVVRASAELLAGNIRHYVFVSSISVYADTTVPGIDETHALATMPDPSSEDVLPFYGALKALCEQTVEAALPRRTTNIRPGLIVGPGDPSDRFSYWPVRVAQGGEVLAPGEPDDPVQFIDARDLADFILTTLERGLVGPFNVSGPAEPLGIGALLDACKAVSGADARFTWASAELLAAQQLAPWSDIPVWVPPVDEGLGLTSISSAKAQAHGLRHRPLADTVQATLEWWATLPAERQARLRAGISREREASVLAALRPQPAPLKPEPRARQSAARTRAR